MHLAPQLARRAVFIIAIAVLAAPTLPCAAAADEAAVAVDDSVTTVEDTPATHIDVLANDTGTDPSTVVTQVSGGSRGTPSVGPGGADVLYEPNPDAFGVDHFTYTISGGSTATVRIEIYDVNDPPIAVDDAYEVASGWGPIGLGVTSNDSSLPDHPESLFVVSTTQPDHGTISIAIDGGGVFYEPDDGYLGPDSFDYTISDGLTDTATVSIQVVVDTTGPTSFAPWQRLIFKPVGTSTVATKLYWTRPTDIAGSGVDTQQLQVSVNGGAFANIALPNPPKGIEGWDRWAMNLRVDRSYKFRLRAKDRAGNVGPWATADPFTLKRFHETSSLATYHGHWSRSYQQNALGGAVYRTNTGGARVDFRFNGTDFALVGTRTTSSGGARIYLDGHYEGVISFKSFQTEWRRIIVTRHVSSGLHTVTIKAVGNGRIDVDAFAVLR
jgi:hypothetical protein